MVTLFKTALVATFNQLTNGKMKHIAAEARLCVVMIDAGVLFILVELLFALHSVLTTGPIAPSPFCMLHVLLGFLVSSINSSRILPPTGLIPL